MAKKRKPLSQIAPTDGEPSNKKIRNEEETEVQQRPGSILYMALKNFMCHSFLEVNFTNNVSVVIGKNGSGKSAILTALIVGLGGKASLTNRGTSVKGFVKAGKPSGSIEIHIYNGGPSGYKPNTYGDKIIIIRNINSSGGGNYRIKSERGEMVSTLNKEIRCITTALQIQVDNPICILNQDTSRNFLSSSDPKQKFILFMRATRLEQLYDEYNKISGNKKECIKMYTNKELSFKKLQDELKKLKRKLEGQDMIINLREKKNLLISELFWAKVRDSEKDLEQKNTQLTRIEKKLDKVKDDKSKKQANINELEEQIRTLENDQTELNDQINVQKRPQMDMKAKLDEVVSIYNDKKKEGGKIRTVIESKSKDAQYLEQEISNANENLSKVEQEKMERLNTLKKFEEKIKKTEDHLQTTRNDLFQVSSDLSHKEGEEQNIIGEIRSLESKLNNEELSLQALKRESGNTLMLYGREMPTIKNLIKQNMHRFVHEPRGPLGVYVKLKEKKWAVAVEGYLAGLLNSFAVDNNKDNAVLREIFQQALHNQRQPTIITSKFIFKKHNVQENLVRAPQDCVGLYDAIEIDDPVVSNCIIDQARIESILLIPSDIRAQELLSNQARVPRNCSQAVTMKGDKYYPDPNYKSYGSRYHHAKYLQVDAKEHMEQMARNIEELRAAKDAKKTDLRAFKQHMSTKVNEKRELEEKIRQLNEAKHRVRQQIKEVTSTVEPEVTNVNVLQTELEEVQNIIQEKTGRLDGIKGELTELKVKIGEMEDKIQQLKKSTKHLEERLDPIKEKIHECQSRIQEISVGDEFFDRHIKTMTKDLNQIRAEMVIIQNTIQTQTTEAQTTGDRPEKLREVVAVSTEITEIERSIARIEVDTDNSPDMVDKFKTLKIKYNNNTVIMDQLKEEISELTVALQKRNRHCKFTESYFITYMKYSFKKILESRQFKGTINIDVPGKKLELVVIPQEGSQGMTTTANLSGGERSFSTVAFLYALWQCMDFPFYFLDEFDVYMDKLNRTKVFNILVGHANSRPDLQHVFLTPQDVSFLDAKEVCILRLQDPQRNP
ncbi:unnamed protein product [Brassicogethes aeneus]|uniref:Rad50/SbcC-type AAA domain-containing protein n=1 Tax=Brassicogethes aeneus TaxID=1431903 RepID=A0A9P0B169_BRAAE|nr:unnamed protein product [Brassicogethes aeneus]